MGTEITEDDITNIQQLCDQVSFLKQFQVKARDDVKLSIKYNFEVVFVFRFR